VLSYGSNSLSAKVASKKPAWLYFSDTWDEYWTAKVDKKYTAVHKANLQFKAIYVPSGNHIIEFKHEPRSFWNLIFMSYLFQIANLVAWKRTKQHCPTQKIHG